MRYATITVVVEGAFEDEADFFDYTLAEIAIRQAAEDAKLDGMRTEIFILEHEHEPGDCECIQYLTDHHPAYVFPGDDPPAEDMHPLA